jgi:ankyrin repeat protein
MTPLMVAAHYGQPEAVRVLLARGANPDFEVDGVSAISIAQNKGWHNVVVQLISASKK